MYLDAHKEAEDKMESAVSSFKTEIQSVELEELPLQF